MKKKRIRRTVVCILALVLLAAIISCFASYLIQPVKEQPETDQELVVCIGDSITFGTGVFMRRKAAAYPYLLDELMDGYEVLNYGYNGATAIFSGDQPYGQELIDAAKAVGANVYIVMLGTNDSKPHNWNAEAYRRDLENILTQLRDLPTTERVVLMSPIAAFEKWGSDKAVYDIRPVVIREEIRGITEAMAEELGIEFLDLYPVFENRRDLLGDGVHPNLDGNQLIAEIIFAFLEG